MASFQLREVLLRGTKINVILIMMQPRPKKWVDCSHRVYSQCTSCEITSAITETALSLAVAELFPVAAPGLIYIFNV